MPIAALPQDAARIISSSLVLNDAASVVKELIDNALDARADAISIELSANTLDIIQVKDNGAGIGVEDRQLLCKRGCTSKIRSIEDLACLGGSFLGFRGEALASVAELSGSVTVTTRIDGELVGTAMKFGPTGLLLSSSSASHSVGTTVRIQDFLRAVPVRKQSALKTAAKSLAILRSLLSSYAFARPEVRFLLKVLKGKNDKAGWTYAPSGIRAPLSEVAAKIVGKEIAAQCSEHTSKPIQSAQADLDSNWAVTGLFVALDSDMQKACSAPQYFCIDGRPVSADRGLMKELTKLYKQYLSHALTSRGDSSKISKPFLCLRIRCPPDSYDVNVEPAKDEVLFSNPSILQNTFERLLKDVYGDLDRQKGEGKASGKLPREKSELGCFSLLLARKPGIVQHSASQSTGEQSLPPQSQADNVSEPTKTHFNMFSVDDVETEMNNKRPEDNDASLVDIGEEETIQSASVTNPWSIASMNARLLPKRMGTGDEPLVGSGAMASTAETTPLFSSPHQVPTGSHRTPLGQRIQLPTPVVSPEGITPYQNPGPPLRRRAPVLDDSDDCNASLASDLNAGVRGRTPLDAWVQPVNRLDQVASFQRARGGSNTDDTFDTSPAATTVLRQSSILGVGSGLSAGELRIPSLPQTQVMRPFRSPFKRHGKDGYVPDSRVEGMSSALDTSEQGIESSPPSSALPSQTPSKTRSPTRSERHAMASASAPQVQLGALLAEPVSRNAELDDIMDFERRKRLTIANQRRQIARGDLNSSGLMTPLSQTQNILSPLSLSKIGSPTRQQRPTPGNINDAREDFDARFGSDGNASTIHKFSQTNPQHSQYIAAANRLSEPQFPTKKHSPLHAIPISQAPTVSKFDGYDRVLDKDFNDESISDSTTTGFPAAIPDSDPRAYLIRHNQLQNQVSSSGMTRNGLKIRRTKTAKLPFETIPARTETHDLMFAGDIMSFDAVQQRITALYEVDEYLSAGKVEPVQWTPVPKEVKSWETRLRELIQAGYSPRYLTENEMDKGDDDEVRNAPLEFELSLSQAIKAHMDFTSVDVNVNAR